MKSIGKSKLYIISLVVSAVIFVGAATLGMLIIHIPNIFGRISMIINAACLFLTFIFFSGTIFSAIAIKQRKAFIKELETENLYTLGHAYAFYNLDAFKKRTTKMNNKRRYSSRKQQIIAFTVATLDSSYNANKSSDITELNYQVALFLREMFEHDTGYYNKRYNVFAFNRGVFFIYNFAFEGKEEQEVREIVNAVTNEIYRIVKDNNMNIWAQPFFGVKEIEADESLAGAIEDALIARSNGETNFESFTLFTKKKNEEDDDMISANEIETALKNNEFVPYYQPKFSVKENRFVGCEVLARWNSPTRGLLTPGMFIDKAEQYGLISTIDLYIFEKALVDLHDSLRKGRRVIPVSCNFSLYEFFSHTFIDTVINLLNQYQVPPHLVEIEITETTSQVNQFLSVSVIKKLKEYGIRVLMDDYGVGYSQIQNLKNIPFDAIKIDKSFADVMLDDEKTKSIIGFLIELGHINGMEVIIEGVEKAEQVEELRAMDIDTIQGFYYSKALSFKDYNAFLKNNEFELKKGENK